MAFERPGVAEILNWQLLDILNFAGEEYEWIASLCHALRNTCA